MIKNRNPLMARSVRATIGRGVWTLARAAGRAMGVSGGRGRGAAVLAGLLAVATGTTVLAGPEGEQVVVGNVTFTRQGNMWVITASNGAIINYASFDILPYETVRFIQPSALSTVLNRINSAAPTLIQGRLEANGNVFFVNPAGVIFGQGATINVGGLYAAAGNISNEDFLAGNLRFTGNTGQVVNNGNITANAVALVGRQVSNGGSIIAQNGTVVMAAGENVYIGRNGSQIYTQIDGSAANVGQDAAVQNTGTIRARGGQVHMSAGDADGMAIFNTGVVQGQTIRMEGQGRGDVIVKGTVDASSADGRGGDITITGERVGLFDANVDASGVFGGGTVRIGGDAGGQGSTRRADYVFVDEHSTVRADAIEAGNGGRITFWGTEATRIAGNISAMGGVYAGDGGFIETSGGYIALAGTPHLQARAASGRGGHWVIDPNNITIIAGGGNTNINAGDPFASADDGAQLGVDLITAALGNGVSVSISTTNSGNDGELGDITLATDLIYSGAGTATLTLNAHNDIVFNSGVTVSGSGAGGLSLVLNANSDNAGGGSVNLGNASLILFGGGLTVGSTAVDYTHSGILNTAGGNVTFNNTGTIFASASTISLGTGDLTVAGSVFNADFGTITGGAGSDLAFNNTANLSVGAIATGGGVTSTVSGLTNFLSTVSASSVSVTNAAVITSNITTTGTQSYGATTLTNNVTLTGAGITFTSTVDSDGTARSLTLNDSGTTTLGGDIGLGSALASLTTNAAGQTVIGGNITTTGAQLFQDAVLLNANTTLTGSGIRFASSLNSQGSFRTLAIIDTGQTRFDAAVGSILSLASLSISGGGTTRIGANVTTDGAQTYGNALTIGADLTLTSTSGAIAFNNTVDALGAGVDLAIAATGTQINGALGGTTAMNSLAISGGPITIGGNITTVGAQTYGNAVTVSASSILTSTGSGAITFSSTVDGSAAGRSLTVNTAGATLFTGAIGATQALFNLTTDAPGTLTLGDTIVLDNNGTFGGSAISFGHNITATNVTFDGPVTLTGNSILNVVNATFNGTVNADDDANNRTLQVDLSVGGVLTFNAAVGGVERLSTLTVTDAGAAQTILHSNISTIGAQNYGSIVTLAGNVILAGGNITFGSAVDADSASNNRTLAITTTGGSTVTFSGAVGSTAALASLAVSDDGAGTTIVNNNITTIGAQTFSENLTLGGDITFATTGGGAIAFGGTVNSDGTPRALTADTTGTITFSGAVGGTSALSTLTTIGGATTIAGGSIRTTTSQTYGGTVNLTANAVLISDAIDFAANVTGVGFTLGFQTFTVGRNIELGTASGNPALVFSTADLGFLQNGFAGLTFGDSTMTGSILVTSDVTFLDATTFTVDGAGGGLIALAANITMNDSSAAATLTLGGPVRLDANVTIASNGTGANGNITFGGTVDADAAGNERTLTINSAGATTFSAALGGTQALGGLTTDTGGSTRIASNMTLTATGDFSFGDAVVLTGDVVLTAENITLAGTVNADDDANNRALTLTSSTLTTIDGDIGATEALGSLTVNGGGDSLIRGDITASGAVFFNNAVRVNGAHITGGSVTFNSTLDAEALGNDISITSTAGDITFLGTIGGSGDEFRNFTTDAAVGFQNVLTSGFRARGLMSLGGATRIDSSMTLQAARFAFGGNVNANAGGTSLTLTADGAGSASAPLITFGGSIGNTSSFSTLTFTGITMTNPAYSSIAFIGDGGFSGGAATDAFTITADTIEFGAGHRVLAVGDLTINATTALTVGDISTAGDLNISSALITVRLRDGGQSQVNPGSADSGIDLGADWVALGSITANGTLQFDDGGSISGTLPSGRVFVVAVGNEGSASGTAIAGLPVSSLLVTEALAQSIFLSGSTILGLDLTSRTSFEQPPIAGLNPTIEISAVSTPQPVSSELAEFMRSLDISLKEEASLEDQLDALVGRALYIDMGDPEYTQAKDRYRITRERLTAENVKPLRDTFRALFQRQEGFTESGEPLFVDDSKRVRESLAKAWKAYKIQAEKPSGKGFRAYLEADEGDTTRSEALDIIRAVGVLFEQIDRLGLSRFEADRPRNSIINRVLSPDIGTNQAARQIILDAVVGETFEEDGPMALAAPATPAP